MNEYCRHFFKLIQSHYKIYPDWWQFENICCKECERNCNKPHKYRIYDHSESGITAASKASAYKTSIDSFSQKAPGCHNYKNAKVINGCLCQLITIEIKYQRANCQNNNASDHTYNSRYSKHTFSILSGCINVILS